MKKLLWICFALVVVIIIIVVVYRKNKTDGKNSVRQLNRANNGSVNVFLIGDIDSTSGNVPQGVASFDKTYTDVQSVVIKNSKSPVVSSLNYNGIQIDQAFYPVSALILSNGSKRLLFGGRYVAATDLE